MKKKCIIAGIAVWVFLALSGFSDSRNGACDFTIMFYNLENFFDTLDNPLKADDEYTPHGAKNWDSQKYNSKRHHIWQVLSSVEYSHYPDIVGLCEVENRAVIEDLLTNTPLDAANYSVFHRESADRRGIDAAILYNRETFKVLDTNAIRINFSDTVPAYHTRDILYMKGVVRQSKDTLHVFVNHWPSRFSGESQTEYKRLMAGGTLRHSIDSVLSQSPKAKILCIGDFNDTPSNSSLILGLGAKCDWECPKYSDIYNISYYLQYQKHLWTYKFENDSDILDQVIVSGALLDKRGVYIEPDNVYPLKHGFMLEPDESGGQKPFRTYNGYMYNGGFSDHLPVVINFTRY